MTSRQLVGIGMILAGALVIGAVGLAFPGPESTAAAVGLAALFDVSVFRWVTAHGSRWQPGRLEQGLWHGFEVIHQRLVGDRN